MLMIFNLGWERFSIGPAVAEANGFMEDMAKAVGVSERVIFNCASLGAGEWVLGRGGKKKEDIPKDTLDYLRWHHHRVLQSLYANDQFRLNREASEMFRTLHRSGHRLMAVFTGPTQVLEDGLKDFRCLEAFGDDVIGYDRLSGNRSYDTTYVGLYREACTRARTEPQETMIVADNPEGVEEGRRIKPQAVVGYVCSAERDSNKDAQIKVLEQARPDYTLIGGASVASLPFLFAARAQQRAERVDWMNFMNKVLTHPAPPAPAA